MSTRSHLISKLFQFRYCRVRLAVASFISVVDILRVVSFEDQTASQLSITFADKSIACVLLFSWKTEMLVTEVVRYLFMNLAE